jgi:RibD C-terminal domain
LQVPGSHRLVQELIESDLVDQINLMVFPVILGTGKKAFEETPDRRKLQLKESKVVGDGVLVLIYERAASTGSHGGWCRQTATGDAVKGPNSAAARAHAPLRPHLHLGVRRA